MSAPGDSRARRGRARAPLVLIPVAAVLAVFVAIELRNRRESAERAIESEAARRDGSATAEVAPRAPSEREDARVPSSAPALARPPAEPPPTPSAAKLRVHGSVFDARGLPVGGALVEIGDAGASARSAADGRFELETEARYGTIRARLPGAVLVRSSRLQEIDLDREHLLVLAPAVAVSGQVVDGAGKALANVSVRLDVPRSAYSRLSVSLETTREERFETASDAAGGFRFEELPVLEGAELVASAPGYAEARVPAPANPVEALRLVLRSEDELPRTHGPVLVGTVVHDDGSSAGNARVRLGRAEARCDADGAFELELDPSQMVPETPLVAAAPGYQPAIEAEFGRRIEQEGDLLRRVRLRLGPPALAIAGRLVRDDGRACAGWQLELLDATSLRTARLPPESAERLASDEPAVHASEVDGSFRFGGLFERSYRLRAWDPRTLQVVDSEPVPAGTLDLELEVPGDAFLEELRGVVQAPDGSPLPDVRVRVSFDVYSSGGSTSSISGETLSTDSSGSFTLHDVPRSSVYLRFDGGGIVPAHRELHASDAGGVLVVEVERRCYFQVEAGGADPPDGARVLDSEGNAVLMELLDSGYSSGHFRMELTDGRSPVLAVRESASQLVLLRGDAECGRIPLRLVPGEVVIARP